MACFVVVHGAFHGGWCFETVRTMLEAKGHTVLTPTLTGVGERAHLADRCTINLDTHIEDIVSLIQFRDLSDVVLCGHSYGCLVITGIADRIAQRISALIHIDGPIPENGDSLFSLLPSVVEAFVGLSGNHGGALVAPPPASAFGVSAEFQDWVNARLTPHPLACFTQTIALTGNYAAIRNRVLIYNSDEIPMINPIPDWYEAQRHREDTQVYALQGGHDLMIDNPDGLAGILLQTAENLRF